MSVRQNLAYASIQVIHNFGAVAAVGGSLAAATAERMELRKKLAWLALAGWGTQAVSGAAFGAVSYYFYHRFPDIAGIATTALGIKMVCAALGFVLLCSYLLFGNKWKEGRASMVLSTSFVLAITAISAAAFLRWFA